MGSICSEVQFFRWVWRITKVQMSNIFPHWLIYYIYYKCCLTFVAGAGGSEDPGPVTDHRDRPDEDRETRALEKSRSWGKSDKCHMSCHIYHGTLNTCWINKLFPAFSQSSDVVPCSDGSLDAAKMAELESRLAAQTTEMEKLKVCGPTRRRAMVVISEEHHFSLDRVPFFVLYILHLLFPSRPLIFTVPSSVQGESKSLSESRAELEQQLASSTSTVAILQTEKAKLQTELQESKKEQDDLLMLLADQDQKIHSLKQKLKDLGEPVDFSIVFLFCFFCQIHQFFLVERLYCCEALLIQTQGERSFAYRQV